LWKKEIVLKDGTKVKVRRETQNDLEMHKAMYSTLREESLKFLPDSDIKGLEDWFAKLDYRRQLPLVAIVSEASGEEKIIATSRLVFTKNEMDRYDGEFGIVVHDNYQNQGLGTELTKDIIKSAKSMGLKKIHLNVFTNNERAIHVYKKCGFKIEEKQYNARRIRGRPRIIEEYRMVKIL